MAGLEETRSVASQLAADRFRLMTELAVAGKSPYPDGAAFVPSDLTPATYRRAVRALLCKSRGRRSSAAFASS
jgi:hypothetical protein